MLKIKTGMPEMEEDMMPLPETDVPEPELMMDEEEDVPPMPEPMTATALPKKTVMYMTAEFGPFECQNCCYFLDQGACSVVAGTIDPYGCCNLFCPPNHDELDEMREEMDEQAEELEPPDELEEEPLEEDMLPEEDEDEELSKEA